VKYAFIKSGQCKAPLIKQCLWLGVSTSGYYDWFNRQGKPVKRHEHSDVIDEAIRIAFQDRSNSLDGRRYVVYKGITTSHDKASKVFG